MGINLLEHILAWGNVLVFFFVLVLVMVLVSVLTSLDERQKEDGKGPIIPDATPRILATT